MELTGEAADREAAEMLSLVSLARIWNAFCERLELPELGSYAHQRESKRLFVEALAETEIFVFRYGWRLRSLPASALMASTTSDLAGLTKCSSAMGANAGSALFIVRSDETEKFRD